MTNLETDTSGCDYCGLPVPDGWFRQKPTSGPRYCCLGCRIAADVTARKGEQGHATWMLARLGLALFFTMNVMMLTMTLWTRDVYGSEAVDANPLAASLDGLFRWLCLVFSAPVLILLGVPLVEEAWQSLRRGRPSTDLLLALGVAASFCISAWAVVRGNGPVYFEVGCVVLAAVTFGRWLEATGKLQTTAALAALEKFLPEMACVMVDGKARQVPRGELRPGDRVRVFAGERLPADGRLVRGLAEIDEQCLTGESQPALKEPGDVVLGGTLNLDGDLTVEINAGPGEGTLCRLIEVVRTARLSKGKYQILAERVSAWFLPLVGMLAVGAAIWHGRQHGLEQGLLAGLAVVLIACPCALGLATPMAVWAAMGQASRAQVLFLSGKALERLAGVKAVCFDKTGTLTTGDATVSAWFVEDEVEQVEVLEMAERVATSSTHPLSKAITCFCQQAGAATMGAGRFLERSATRTSFAPESVRTIPGRGLCGRVGMEATPVYLGSLSFMHEQTLLCGPRLRQCVARLDPNSTAVGIGWNGQLKGIFCLQEEVRPEAAAALEDCRKRHLSLTVFTGDRLARAAAIGRQLMVPAQGDMLPQDKVNGVRRLHENIGPVVMVGDGINDAPALASADVGMALGCGADISRQSADVCLIGNDLRRVAWTIDLARRTVRVIRQNLFWAFAYNVVGVAAACTGRLNPVWAALAMVVSSLLVVGNSLRLASTTDLAEQRP